MSKEVAKKLNANDITIAEYLSILSNLVCGVFDQAPEAYQEAAREAFIKVISKDD